MGGKDMPEEAVKAGSFITKDGRVIFVGGPGSGGGGASGVTVATAEQQMQAAQSAAQNLGMENIISGARNAEQLRERGIGLLAQSGYSDNEAEDTWDSEYNFHLSGNTTVPKAPPKERFVIDEPEQSIPSRQSVGRQQANQIIADYDSGRISYDEFISRVAVMHGDKSIKGIAFAFKALDGSDWWMQWTTNAFQDREGENFQTKALNDFVERHRGEKIKGEFWYRHIPGTKFGDVTWQAMIGRFLVQAGPFDDTLVGQAFKSFFQANPAGHEQIAPEGWGTSHGYQYNATDRKDRVYEWLEIKESTVLPLHAASNPWSPHPRIIQRSKEMNEQERKELEQIGGKQLVDLVTREGEQRTKELEGMGVGYKSLSGAMAKVMALMEAVEDSDIKAALAEIYGELESPDDEEMPAEAMDIEEDMAEMPVEDMMMAEAEAGKDQVAMKDVATRTEVADALATLTTELRAEVKEAVTASTQQITDALTPLLAEVKELRKRDGEKIAEKAAATPAASLRDMVQSVLDQKSARVEDASLFGKPAETQVPPRPEQGMPSFLANMFKQ